MLGRLAAISCLVVAMALAGCTGNGPSNPIDELPKVIFDHVEGETLVTVLGVGEHRYDEININYTITGGTVNNTVRDRYVMDVNISASAFVVNVTIRTGEDVYMLNCTVEVKHVSPDEVVLLIQEEDEDEPTERDLPYKRLAKWRDLS